MTTVSYLEIQNDCTFDLTHLLFEPAEELIARKVEALYRKQKRISKSDADYNCLCTGTDTFPREERSPRNKSVIYLDDSLYEEGQQLSSFKKNCNDDCRFIQMWLSTFMLSCNTSDEIRPYLPNMLANLSDTYKNIPCSKLIIPEGMDSLWQKAQSKISFYVGLKLLLN